MIVLEGWRGVADVVVDDVEVVDVVCDHAMNALCCSW